MTGLTIIEIGEENARLTFALEKQMQTIRELRDRWRRGADQYQRQVEEARSKNLPHDQMLSMMTCLRSCARDLESSVAARPNTRIS